MAKVVVDLSHPFSAEIPRWPYFDKPEIVGAHSMAKRWRSYTENHMYNAYRYTL